MKAGYTLTIRLEMLKQVNLLYFTISLFTICLTETNFHSFSTVKNQHSEPSLKRSQVKYELINEQQSRSIEVRCNSC
jgi:hypothetical protein